MDTRKLRIFGAISIFISILVIALSLHQKSIVILFIGIFMTVVSVISAILLPSLNIFKEDRLLNEEKIIAQGLHVVKCTSCDKKNVLEDKYCVFCGEDLVAQDE